MLPIEILGNSAWADAVYGDGQFGNRSGAECFAEKPGEGPASDYRDRAFDFGLFFSFFPEFDPSAAMGAGEVPQYSLAFISAAAKEAGMYVKPTWCRELDGHDREYVYYLTVAHVCVLNKQAQSGLR